MLYLTQELLLGQCDQGRKMVLGPRSELMEATFGTL